MSASPAAAPPPAPGPTTAQVPAPESAPGRMDDDRVTGKAFDVRLIRRLLTYVRPYRAQFVLAIVATTTVVAMELLSVEAVKELIDGPLAEAIRSGRGVAAFDAAWGTILAAAAQVGALVVVAAGLRVFQARWTSRVAQRAMRDLRVQVFAHVHRQGLRFFDRNPVGRLVTRVVQDVDGLAEVLTSGLEALFHDVFLLVAIVAWLLFVDWKLTLVTMLVLPPLALATHVFRTASRRAFRLVRERVAALSSTLQETIQGVRVVQAFGCESRVERRFRAEDAALRDAHVANVRTFAVFFPSMELVSAAGRVLLLWWGGREIAGDRLTFGELTQFVVYMELFFQPIRDLSETFTTMQSSMASAERLFKLLDRPSDLTSPPGGLRPARLRGEIEFRGVGFSYEPGRPALRDVSFRVAPGETVALVGATGAGKSTVASLLTRLYDPDAGSVLLDGEDARRYDLRALRGSIAVVPQDVFLFAGTIEENLRLGHADLPRERLLDACTAVGADRILARLPQGLATPAGERGSRFSVGERQLLALARALAQDPPVLLLDEATSSVDSETEHLIQSALAKLQEGRTTVVIAHRLSTIRRADRILVFHHGELREQGTHEELVALDGVYATLHRLQFA